MAGIVSYGAYVPFNRLQRSAIGAALEARAGRGERAIASYDEDAVTMGVEAARTCLHDADVAGIRNLFFATTEPPYQEKLNAATVHAALSLPDGVRSLDVTGSIGAGMSGLLAALDGAAAGRDGLAVMSDIRLGAPEGAAEQSSGDGAAAFRVGDSGCIANLVATYSETLEHQGVWRLPGELFAKTWEDRFALTQVYVPLLARAAERLFSESGVAPSDIARFVIDAPNPRAIVAEAKTLKIAPERMADGFLEMVGHTGAAHTGMMLASALDKARPGDRIAVFSTADGVDAALFEVTGAIASHTNPKPVDSLLASKRNDLAYMRYLKWRGILPVERPRRPDPKRPAGPIAFRRKHWKFGFVGTECTACGTRHLPPQSVCVKCGASEQMREIPFANRQGRIATYTLDQLAYSLQPPMVAAMVDFDGGGRVEVEMTDCEPEKVAIGDTVEMTFRRLFTADGVHNYFWKARPVR